MATGLTPRQQRFVDEYLIDLNATQAAIRAGYSCKGATVRGAELLANRKVAEAIEAAEAARSERVQVDQDWVLRRWIEIADADPRDLIQYIRTSCEKCWDDGERPDPNPECSGCGGRGRGHVVLTDTRKLSGPAKRLYAGVQLGKDGIRVNMRDQDEALTNIARHLGMFPSKVELTGKDGGPVESVSMTKAEFVEVARKVIREV